VDKGTALYNEFLPVSGPFHFLENTPLQLPPFSGERKWREGRRCLSIGVGRGEARKWFDCCNGSFCLAHPHEIHPRKSILA
jgi:hypothetical protein